MRLELEANLIVDTPQGEATQYVRETWVLFREKSARTRPWKGVRTFGCPSCGAPLEQIAQDKCRACGQTMADGRFDWKVQGISVTQQEDRPPSLTGTVEERGTDAPTVSQPDVAGRKRALFEEDPALSDAALEARLRHIYSEMYAAWNAMDLAGIRPYVSDGLFAYLSYWIDAYKRQGLRNVVDNPRLTGSRVAKIVRDKHYDAITFRVWATGRDYTIEEKTGQVVGGSREDERAYTEYWTLIQIGRAHV